MGLSPPATIAAQIKADVDAIVASIPPGSQITPTETLAIITAWITRIYADFQANAQVDPGSFAAGGSPGPVTGLGGPIV